MKKATTKLLAISLLGVFLGLAGCQANPLPQESPSTAIEPRNRLSKEKSPYLQQHADNVVDWYPWGEEAFQKAKAENKPVFLSIGYSTCHWCHVMEEESFMDPKIGDFLKKNFVSIKVDRETRPDVDAIYMNFVQETTGSGGWPLTVFLTPDGVPIHGGTYFPNPPRYNKIGFLQLIEKVSEAWKTDQKKLVEEASAFSEQIAQESRRAGSDKLPPESTFETALQAWSGKFDPQHGGFLPAPKFPSPPDLDFMLRYAVVKGDARTKEMVLATLRGIALGGIRDHLEGGFHRYSTDAKWLVPHFEKMLYDQAQLVSLYSKAYAWEKDPLFKEAVVTTASYLDLRMRSPEGAFYSAEDADSSVPGHEEEHAEGAFYVWSLKELRENLKPEELELVKSRFGVTEEGNATGDPQGELSGKNVLFLKDQKIGASEDVLTAKLLELRNTRPRPHRDDKILTEWNAMMAAGLADAARYLENPSYLAGAKRALKFVEDKMVVDGKLKRSYLDGAAEVDGFAVDHAQLVNAYLRVFLAGGDAYALERAIHWQSVLDKEFWDAESGGYFDTTKNNALLYRRKTRYDGATSSTVSCTALNLTTLHAITGDKKYLDRLEATLKDGAQTLRASPGGLPGALSALYHWYGKHQSLIVVSDRPDWQRATSRVYQPERAVILVTSQDQQKRLQAFIPYLPEWTDRSAAYFCQNFTCELPLENLDEVEKRL
jgi:uncharacterized protein